MSTNEPLEALDPIDTFIDTVYEGLVKLHPQDRIEVGRHTDLYPDPDNKMASFHNRVIIRLEFKDDQWWTTIEQGVSFMEINLHTAPLAQEWIYRISRMRGQSAAEATS